MTEAARPFCETCGKAYGQRWCSHEYVVFPHGGKVPPYTGDQIVNRETMIIAAPHTGSGIYEGVKYGPNDNVLRRELWDGTTWQGGYEPFCTLRCALVYARKAYSNQRKRHSA